MDKSQVREKAKDDMKLFFESLTILSDKMIDKVDNESTLNLISAFASGFRIIAEGMIAPNTAKKEQKESDTLIDV